RGGRVEELENRCVIVRGLDVDQLTERVCAAGMYLLQDLHDAELHVGAGHGVAVVELHVVAELECNGLSVVADRPGFRQARLRLEIEIVFEQSVEDLGRHLADRSRCAEIGCKCRRLRLNHHDQRSAALLSNNNRRRQQAEGRDRRPDWQDSAYHRASPDIRLSHFGLSYFSPINVSTLGRRTARLKAYCVRRSRPMLYQPVAPHLCSCAGQFTARAPTRKSPDSRTEPPTHRYEEKDVSALLETAGADGIDQPGRRCQLAAQRTEILLDEGEQQQRIAIVWHSPLPWIGKPAFVCPACNRDCYCLHEKAGVFACRQCHGMAYAS